MSKQRLSCSEASALLSRFSSFARVVVPLLLLSLSAVADPQTPPITEPQRYVPPELQVSDPSVKAYLDSAEKSAKVGNDQECLTFLQKALQLSTNEQSVADGGIVEDKFAVYYFTQGKVEDAKSHWLKSLSDGIAISNLALQSDVLVALATLQQASGHLDQAMQTVNQALELSRKSKSLYVESRVLGELCRLQLLAGKLADARAAEEWNAAAPFVDTYRLVRRNGKIIHLHEINWWPLILSAKCRVMVAKEAALIGPDYQHTSICSAKTENDVNGRFKSYQWITDKDISPPNPSKPAPFNRHQKANVLDWGFTDAVLALGPLGDYLIEGIRELVRDSYATGDDQEYVVVSHSLGSYLMFSALDIPDDSQSVTKPWKHDLDDILRKTSYAYFMANQIRLLELANLSDDGKKTTLKNHLENWSKLYKQAHPYPPQIVAFSDPSDWLTWQVPENDDVTITNLSVKNAHHWFWYIENPATAHLNYDENKRVVKAMVPKQ